MPESEIDTARGRKKKEFLSNGVGEEEKKKFSAAQSFSKQKRNPIEVMF